MCVVCMPRHSPHARASLSAVGGANAGLHAALTYISDAYHRHCIRGTFLEAPAAAGGERPRLCAAAIPVPTLCRRPLRSALHPDASPGTRTSRSGFPSTFSSIFRSRSSEISSGAGIGGGGGGSGDTPSSGPYRLNRDGGGGYASRSAAALFAAAAAIHPSAAAV